jgi:hypothetical protein
LAHEQGEYGSARTLFRESLELNRELGNKIGVAYSLLGLGLVGVSTGQSEMGAGLLGAVEAMIEEMGTRLENEEQIAYDRATATARNQLGDQTFNLAWQKGHETAIEETIKYALQTEQP